MVKLAVMISGERVNDSILVLGKSFISEAKIFKRLKPPSGHIQKKYIQNIVNMYIHMYKCVYMHIYMYIQNIVNM